MLFLFLLKVLANENTVKRKLLEGQGYGLGLKIKYIGRTFSLDEGIKIHEAWNMFLIPP